MLRNGAGNLAKSARVTWLCQLPQAPLKSEQAFQSAPPLISRACFASAAGAATKEGSEAKKEVKKSALESFLSAVKASV